MSGLRYCFVIARYLHEKLRRQHFRQCCLIVAEQLGRQPLQRLKLIIPNIVALVLRETTIVSKHGTAMPKYKQYHPRSPFVILLLQILGRKIN
jgi:hypothetical protein